MPNGTTDEFTISKEELLRLLDSYVRGPESPEKPDLNELLQSDESDKLDPTLRDMMNILKNLPDAFIKLKGKLRLLPSLGEPEEKLLSCEEAIELVASVEKNVLCVREYEYTSYWIHLGKEESNILLVSSAFDNSIEGALFSSLRAVHLLRSGNAARRRQHGELSL
jgi:hypothetical protein